MRCHTKNEWILFINGDMNPEESEQMERHMMKCKNCMDLYIGLSERMVDMAPSPAFAERVMEAIHSEEKQADQNRQLKPVHLPRRRMIAHYAIATSLTIALTAAGLFQAPENVDQLIRYGWSDNLVDRAVSIIDLIRKP